MASDEVPTDDKGFTVHDQRWWLKEGTELEKLADQGKTERLPTVLEDLQARLEEKDRRIQELLAAQQAAEDSLDTVRQRLQGDVERRVSLERVRLAEPFLEALDGLERLQAAALAAGSVAEPLATGVELLRRQLDERLAGLGLVRVPVEPGQAFDPRLMEALGVSAVEAERDGQVLAVVRPGYLLGENLVRAAGVIVGAAGRTDVQG